MPLQNDNSRMMSSLPRDTEQSKKNNISSPSDIPAQPPTFSCHHKTSHTSAKLLMNERHCKILNCSPLIWSVFQIQLIVASVRHYFKAHPKHKPCRDTESICMACLKKLKLELETLVCTPKWCRQALKTLFIRGHCAHLELAAHHTGAPSHYCVEAACGSV